MAITPRMPKTTMPTTIQTHGLTLPAILLAPLAGTPKPRSVSLALLYLLRVRYADRVVALGADRDRLRGRAARAVAVPLPLCQARHLEMRTSLHPPGGPRDLRKPEVRERVGR